MERAVERCIVRMSPQQQATFEGAQPSAVAFLIALLDPHTHLHPPSPSLPSPLTHRCPSAPDTCCSCNP